MDWPGFYGGSKQAPPATLPNPSFLFLSTVNTAFDNPIVLPLVLSHSLNTCRA
ncbi:hypothetical protein EGR_11211 [Echinococcus granulosus]|uniref:Uncharacterized protein n=1 Tax=Echinococcus granulosus TaxID=6210 RepID=W6U6H1_ECHGR|nr:hypothetical protein EGR_11211 [Echinococcus granulosus]EUB53932.1 hypothetical protein EGR_11211 [Echinococcus granulosus]